MNGVLTSLLRKIAYVVVLQLRGHLSVQGHKTRIIQTLHSGSLPKLEGCMDEFISGHFSGCICGWVTLWIVGWVCRFCGYVDRFC